MIESQKDPLGEGEGQSLIVGEGVRGLGSRGVRRERHVQIG